MSDLADLSAPPPPRARLTLTTPSPSLGGRATWGLELWRQVLAYAAMGLTPVLAYVGNLGFAALAALLGMGALVFLGRKAAPSLGAALLLALLVWALVSMSWSPAMPAHPDFHRYRNIQALTGVKLVFELAFYTAFVMAMRQVSDETAARASLVLGIGLALLSALLVIECLDGATLYQWIKLHLHQKERPDFATRNVARACYVSAVLFWPVALRLRRAASPIWLVLLAAGLVISAFVFKVDSPILALGLSGVVFLAVRQFGRGAVWALIAGMVAYFAAAPLVAHVVTGMLHPHELPGDVGKHSWAVRLDIWRFASGEILANPLLGWGLDSSRSWPNDIPLHPHDAALQLWLELGALGPLLAALFWGWLLSRVASAADQDRDMAAAATAAAAAYLTIGALSFGVWQEWWLAVGAIAIVVCLFVAAGRRLDPLPAQGLLELQPIG